MTTHAAAPARRGVRGVRWWASLRSRIALAVAIASLLVAATVAVFLAGQAADDAQTSLRDQALGRLTAAAEGYRVDGRLRFDATIDPDAPPAPLVEGIVLDERRTYLDDDWMWASERIGPDIIMTVRVPAAPLHQQDAERVGNLGLAALIGVLASSALGWAVGTTLSRRLRRAATAADGIAGGRSDVRLDTSGRDEVASLVRAVDEMAAALRSRLETEKAFTADVAHELRTPLTGLVSAAELLPDDEVSALVRRQVQRLRTLVDDLLEISRLDHGAEPARREETDLVEVVSDAVERLVPAAGLEPDAVTLLDPADPQRVMIDPRRFDRVLANLFVNVARHGGGRCSVGVRGTTVIVRDDGPGYPEDLLSSGPQRFHAGGRFKGSGLGLTIALKQAESMGATVVPANDGGAVTTVHCAPVSAAQEGTG